MNNAITTAELRNLVDQTDNMHNPMSKCLEAEAKLQSLGVIDADGQWVYPNANPVVDAFIRNML